jgi:hypothetical protein
MPNDNNLKETIETYNKATTLSTTFLKLAVKAYLNKNKNETNNH